MHQALLSQVINRPQMADGRASLTVRPFVRVLPSAILMEIVVISVTLLPFITARPLPPFHMGLLMPQPSE
jgi:hypothetical protein